MAETEKNRGGRPRVDATPVTVRIPPAQLAELDTWIEQQPEPRPSRPEAIRRLLEGRLVLPEGLPKTSPLLRASPKRSDAIKLTMPTPAQPPAEPVKPAAPVEVDEVLPRRPLARRAKSDAGQARGKTN